MKDFGKVEKRIKEFEDFYKSQVFEDGYVTALRAVGNNIFKEMDKKYGIPVVKFGVTLENNIKDGVKKIIGDVEYFEQFDAYRMNFPKDLFVLNTKGKIDSFENSSNLAAEEQPKIWGKGDWDARDLYSRLCSSKSIYFGDIIFPFDFLWENKSRGMERMFNEYEIKAGKRLKLNLEKGWVSFNANFR